jgi:uncharacterized protein (DUF1015 family)
MPAMALHRTSLSAAGALELAPFRGVRYDPAHVPDLAAVTSPPYDVIEPDRVPMLETADPHNVVRLILPRDDIDHSAGRYRHAAAALTKWLQSGVLMVDPEPALYVYEQVTAISVQRGLIGALGLRQPDERVILPHEDHMPGPVADRLELMRAARANLEPILLAYEGGGPASAAVEATIRRPPLISIITPDRVKHRLWRITDAPVLAAIAADLAPRQALIADGHHRYATYLRLQAEYRDAGKGAGPWDRGLALLVDSTRHPLELRAIHRVLPKLPVEDALAAVAPYARVTELATDLGGSPGPGEMRAHPGEHPLDALPVPDLEAFAPAHGTAFLVVGEGRQWVVTDVDPQLLAAAVPADRPKRWRRLDAAVLNHALLEQVWGVTDDIEQVTYHHDARQAVRAAAKTGGTAILLRPVDVETIVELAAEGIRMPGKSTSFGPKPRTGLILRTFAAG